MKTETILIIVIVLFLASILLCYFFTRIIQKQQKKIQDYKDLCKYANIPQLIIDYPHFIKGSKVTQADIEWAKEFIKNRDHWAH